MTSPEDLPPDIAIIIAAWNSQDTLGRALDSLLSQEGISMEVFVVDDASTDGTLACAQSFAARDPRVTVLAQAKNAGPATARNRALDAVTARYATPLDSDDFMDPGRLARLLEIATQDNWDFVGDDLFKVDEACTDGLRKRLWSQTNIGTIPITFADFIRGNLSSRHGGRGELGFLKPLISMQFLNDHGLRYQNNMRLGEDYVLYATALLKGAHFCVTDPVGYVAVTRSTSLSGHHSARDIGALVQADRLLMCLPDMNADEQAALRAHYIETLKKWHWMRLIDAVKARKLITALQCFAAPPVIIVSLLRHLGRQIVLRSIGWLPWPRGTDRKGGQL